MDKETTSTTTTTTHKGDDRNERRGKHEAEGGKEVLDEKGLDENSQEYRDSTGNENIENAKAEAMANSHLEDGELNPENYRSGDEFTMKDVDQPDQEFDSNGDPKTRNR